MRLLFTWILLLVISSGYSQIPTSHEITNYPPSTYGSHNQNWDIAQDQRGVMYFANGDGLLEFDGTNWNKYFTAKATTLLSVDIDDNGLIYTGGIQEFGYFAPNETGKLTFHSLSDQLPEDLGNYAHIWETRVIGEHVYFRSKRYLFVYYNGRIEVLKPKDEFISGFEIDGKFWVVDTGRGIATLEGMKLQFIPGSETYKDDMVLGIESLGPQELLIVQSDAQLSRFNMSSGQVKPFVLNVPTDPDRHEFYASYELKSGKICLLAMQSGITIFDKSGYLKTNYTAHDGLFSGKINALFEDRENNLWFATNKGISWLNLGSPVTMLRSEGNYAGIVNALEMHHGSLYLGTDEAVYQLLNRDINQPEKQLAAKLPGVNKQCFDLLSYGEELWIATTDGIFISKNQQAKGYNETYSRSLLAVEQEGVEQILAGGRQTITLYRKTNEKWTEAIYISDFPDEILHMEQDVNSGDSLVFWCGLFSNGLARLAVHEQDLGYSIKVYNKGNGFDEGYVVPYKIAQGIRFITKFNSVYYLDDNGDFVEDKSIGDHLGEEASYLLKDDAFGNIYLEASGPVYFLEKEGEGYVNDPISLGFLDVGYVNDILVDSSGICWLGAEEALVRFDRLIDKDYDQPFNAIIRKIQTAKDSLIFDGTFGDSSIVMLNASGESGAVLPYHSNEMTFGFSTLFFQSMDKTTYSYQLEGYNEEWSSWKTEPKAVYTNLGEGSYTFRVRAMNVYGKISQPCRYSFTILPPWYRTWWAYAGYAVGAVILIYLLILLNSRRLKAANLRLQNIIEDKTSEIKGQRDLLQVQKDEVERQRDIVEEKNRDILNSINYARRLQEAILPTKQLIKENLRDSFILYNPRDIVSGDFYWMETLDDRVIFAAADCTGHGVPGAMVSVVCSNVLNKTVRELQLTDPGTILDKSRELVIEHFAGSKDEVKDGMDIALCSLFHETNELHFAGANNPLWIIRKDAEEIEVIKPNKQPIGVYRKQRPFETHKVQLQPGDSFFIFSDGYADQFGGDEGKKFMTGNLKKLLVYIRNLPMEKQREQLAETFEVWKGDLEQIDDVCVMGVKI